MAAARVFKLFGVSFGGKNVDTKVKESETSGIELGRSMGYLRKPMNEATIIGALGIYPNTDQDYEFRDNILIGDYDYYEFIEGFVAGWKEASDNLESLNHELMRFNCAVLYLKDKTDPALGVSLVCPTTIGKLAESEIELKNGQVSVATLKEVVNSRENADSLDFKIFMVSDGIVRLGEGDLEVTVALPETLNAEVCEVFRSIYGVLSTALCSRVLEVQERISKEEFLERINQSLSEGKIFNPFSLQYPPLNYN